MESTLRITLLLCLLTIFNAIAAPSVGGDNQLRRTCGTETTANETSFLNPDYPLSEDAGVANCQFTALPMADDICQIRVDMDEFSLAQPNVDGQCIDDFMTVTGSYSNVPTVCGDNTGQHMYVEVDPSSSWMFRINIDTSVAGARWNIRITQIQCNSLYKAPQGCLQYYTETSGIVSSFNYMTATSTPISTRQLANQQYAVCVQSHPGYCGLSWSQPAEEGEEFFSVTGDPGSHPSGASGVSLTGDQCYTDYVIIPNAVVSDALHTTDRFCGEGFPASVVSTMTPYSLFVAFNSNELDLSGTSDFSNQGFSLAFRMTTCDK